MGMHLILAVDDDPTFSAALKDFLESKGYLVEQAFSGVEASEKAQTMRPCLIILDMLMPVTYGNSVYQTLQRQSYTKNIPVIFLSAVDPETIKRTITPSPRIRILKKPADWKALEKYIHELIGDTPAAI